MQIFSKTLSQTDISKRCVVPMKYFKMKRFPKPKEGSHMVEFVVTDESGHDWNLCCSTRNVGKDLKIKVEKQASPPEARRSPVMNQNLEGSKGSIGYNSDNEAPAIFQSLSFGVPNFDLGGNTAVKTSSIDKEQIPSLRGTSQHIGQVRPSQGLSLELTLKPTMTGGTTAATSSGIDKEQKPTFHSNSQGKAINDSETPTLMSLSLGLNPILMPGPTKEWGQSQTQRKHQSRSRSKKNYGEPTRRTNNATNHQKLH